MMSNFEILEWDSKFFGFNVAKINDRCLLPEDFNNLYHDLKQSEVKLIYWPSDYNCTYQHEIARKYNGKLVDIKTQYEKDINKKEKIHNYLLESSAEIYQGFEADDRLLEIAVQCGEYSRYRTDCDFPQGKFEELYKLWLIKSLKKELADDVIITKKDGKVKGLITVSCQKGTGNIGLFGVHSDSRGKGEGSVLIQAALNYFIIKNCHKVNVVTQGLNKAACRLYEKYGFRVNDKTNFYHFWVKKLY